MAMLMMNDVFERTWGDRAGAAPGRRLLAERHPGRQERPSRSSSSSPRRTGTSSGRSSSRASTTATTSGSMTGSSTAAPRPSAAHLTADLAYQQRLVRFIENHDEPRAAATFSSAQARAAAVATLTQTGARLVHEGQLEGRTVQLPVFLGRRPDEPDDPDLKAFYELLLAALGDDVFRDGEWQLGGRSGWDGNDTWENLVAWGWRGESRKLVVVNLSGEFGVRPRLAALGRLARAGLAARRRSRRRALRARRRRPPRRPVRRPRAMGVAPLHPDAPRDGGSAWLTTRPP